MNDLPLCLVRLSSPKSFLEAFLFRGRSGGVFVCFKTGYQSCVMYGLGLSGCRRALWLERDAAGIGSSCPVFTGELQRGTDPR
jgi:hypothetical protein